MTCDNCVIYIKSMEKTARSTRPKYSAETNLLDESSARIRTAVNISRFKMCIRDSGVDNKGRINLSRKDAIGR